MDGGRSEQRRTTGGRWEQTPRRPAGIGAATGNGREQQGRREQHGEWRHADEEENGRTPEERIPATRAIWKGQGFTGVSRNL